MYSSISKSSVNPGTPVNYMSRQPATSNNASISSTPGSKVKKTVRIQTPSNSPEFQNQQNQMLMISSTTSQSITASPPTTPMMQQQQQQQQLMRAAAAMDEQVRLHGPSHLD